MPSRSDLLEALGRFGYAVKGIVYALLGFVALDAALTPSSPEGSSGLFRWISGGPLGDAVVGGLGLGLAAYALWRLALAILDPEGGDTGAGKRAYYVFSGLSYGFLAYQAGRFLFGVEASGAGSPGGGGGTEERTDVLLSLPYGRLIVGALALAALGYGIRQFVRAYKTPFAERMDLDRLSPEARTWAVRLARSGMAARGVVYLVVTGLFATAAWNASPEASGGLEDALVSLKAQPFGGILLGVVAIGLVGYGVYCGMSARYRRYG